MTDKWYKVTAKVELLVPSFYLCICKTLSLIVLIFGTERGNNQYKTPTSEPQQCKAK